MNEHKPSNTGRRESGPGSAGANAPQPSKQGGHQVGRLPEPRPWPSDSGPSSFSGRGSAQHTKEGAGAASGPSGRDIVALPLRGVCPDDRWGHNLGLSANLSVLLDVFGLPAILYSLRELALNRSHWEYGMHRDIDGRAWHGIADTLDRAEEKIDTLLNL